MAYFKGKNGGQKALVYIFAAAGSLVAIAAVGSNNGWVPSTFFLGITAAELGLLSAVSFAVSILLYLM